MGYQALLFCPDEKTARTVTQVLSELDFSVIPCTEPFAAVKKLMNEHFDAVVVDCDNEQNATLLFKSARNAPNNHSSLAVAVVEGQAGVAKAFRIGANLVLTKPVNVEQAKGTLRVARGLLRKSEAAKPATGAAGTAVKPAAAAAPSKPAPQRTTLTVSTAGAVTPIAPSVAASIPTQTPTQPRVMASVPSEIIESDAEILEVSEEIASPSMVAPLAKIASSQPEILSSTVGHPASSGGFGASAASAPAPAREPKPSVATEHKPSTVISEPERPVEKVAASGSGASVEEIPAPGTSFTLGGNVSSASESGNKPKKILLAVAAVVLVAAIGYAVWTQWVVSGGGTTAFTHVAAQPVKNATKVPAATPSVPVPAVTASAPVPVAASSGTSSATSSGRASGTASIPASTPDATDSADVADKVRATEAPAMTSAAKPLVIKSGGSRPAAKPAVAADAPAPSVAGIAAGGNSAALPSLMGSGKAPAPVLQTLNVSQGVSRGLLVKEIAPAYPPIALHMRIEGAVELMATITKSGNISGVKVLSGDPQLSHAAVDAVKQWKYKPYLLNGEPVEIQTQVTVKFKLPR
jgi:protein TonB